MYPWISCGKKTVWKKIKSDLNQRPGIPFQTTAHNTPQTLQNIISKEQSECQEADTDSKLQHFIAALAKVRFLKLVKIGHFCMKCYNFTSLPSYMQKPKPVVKRILKELEKRISSNIQMGSLTQWTTSTWKQTKPYSNK